MKFLLESNPAFLLLEVENNEYVFYNSLQHIGARLSHLEVQILDLVYTYQDKEYIISKFSEPQRTLIANAISSIEEHHLLKCEEIFPLDNNNINYPTTYYIHLTYRCNLSCTYCYNKTIRKQLQQDLNLDEWKRIIDKIIPYAKRVVFTGGECLLYEGIAELMHYIKSLNNEITIAVISNGMHNFEEIAKTKIFSCISELSLSCDSMHQEGERKGFNPSLFRANIEWVKNNAPNVSLSLSSVYTCRNRSEIERTKKFCYDNKLTFSATIILPDSASEIELMPSIEEIYSDNFILQGNSKKEKLNRPRFRCEAGRAVCSIAPNGDVFPCQSFHYPELLMGNLVTEDIDNISKNITFKGVNDIPVCSRCNVKYICGGGCLATGYAFYGHRYDRNHLTCHLNRHNAIEILKSLDNRLNK